MNAVEGLIEVVYSQAHPPEAEGPFLAEERALLESLAEMLVGYVELRKHQERLEELVAQRTQELLVAKEGAEHANRAILSNPVISPAKWRTIMELDRPGFERHVIELNYDESVGLEAAVRSFADQAEAA